MEKGIVNIKPKNKQAFLEENGLNEVTFIELFNDLTAFKYVIGKYVLNLSEKYSFGNLLNTLYDEETGFVVVGDKIKNSISPNVKCLFDYRSDVETPLSQQMIKTYDDEIKQMNTIYAHLEKNMNLDEFNLMETLIEHINMLCNSFSSKYFEYTKHNIEKYNFMVSQIQKGNSVQDIIKTKQFNILNKSETKFVREFEKEYGLDSSEPIIKAFKRRVEINEKKGGIKAVILTDEDGKTVLEKYGLPELIPEIYK
ncbi:hypothetical protein GQ472_02435 [archaeon]|nr:hypothetical protein [archaeon]